MSTQTIFASAGATSKTVDIALVQNAAATSPGDPLTGLAFNTASLTCYQRKGATTTPTAVTLATQTVGGAFSAGGFVELDATHMPGGYRFDIPNALLAASGETNITFTGAANLATHTLKIIVTALDLFSTLVQNWAANAMTESYAGVGSAPTPVQALFEIRQILYELSFSGTTGTIKKLDHTAVAHTVTIDDPANPTSVTQTT